MNTDPKVLSYVRSYKGENVVVVLNMSGEAQTVNFNLAAKGWQAKSSKTLLSSFGAPDKVDPGKISIEPFGAWIGEI